MKAVKLKVQGMKNAGSFGAVILAGGYSSRMKAFKPLLPVGSGTAIEMLIAAFRDAGIVDIAVVSGHNRDRLLPVIEKAGVAEVYNADYAEGMFSSIQAGIGYAKDTFRQAQGFLLAPVDCPLVSKAVLKRLVEAAVEEGSGAASRGAGTIESCGTLNNGETDKTAESTESRGLSEADELYASLKDVESCEPLEGSETGKPANDDSDILDVTGLQDIVHGLAGENDADDALHEFADEVSSFAPFEPSVVRAKTLKNFYVPVFEGKKGHPLLIPAVYSGEICRYDDPGGLKAITDRHWDRMVRVPVEDEGCVLDMDTPEGYEEILAFQKTGGRRESLQELAAGRRIFLIRHGQTKQHREKMFIGQYDVPLKEGTYGQVAAMAKEIAGHLMETAGGRNVSGCSGSSGQRPEKYGGSLVSWSGIIYTSPLKRAEQTAEIIRDVFMREAADGKEFAGTEDGSVDGGKRVNAANGQAGAANELAGTGKRAEAEESCDAGQWRARGEGRNIAEKAAAEEILLAERKAHMQENRHTGKQMNELNAGEKENRFKWELQQVSDLQEIALGNWDGMPISEVKKKYPLDYERRGDDIFSFKIGNRAENFYDVQYRAVKALREILQKDQSRDILLVTHSTVIRALENNLKGLRVDDPWDQLAKNDFRVISL